MVRNKDKRATCPLCFAPFSNLKQHLKQKCMIDEVAADGTLLVDNSVPRDELLAKEKKKESTLLSHVYMSDCMIGALATKYDLNKDKCVLLLQHLGHTIIPPALGRSLESETPSLQPGPSCKRRRNNSAGRETVTSSPQKDSEEELSSPEVSPVRTVPTHILSPSDSGSPTSEVGEEPGITLPEHIQYYQNEDRWG